MAAVHVVVVPPMLVVVLPVVAEWGQASGWGRRTGWGGAWGAGGSAGGAGRGLLPKWYCLGTMAAAHMW